MNPAVYLCELTTKGYPTHEWLCREDIDARKVVRDQLGHLIWSGVREVREVSGRCADCETRRQAAPGYVTPTVVPALLKARAA